jgi:hypothetical protein
MLNKKKRSGLVKNFREGERKLPPLIPAVKKFKLINSFLFFLENVEF